MPSPALPDPLGLPSQLHRYENGETVVFTAGGVGLPPVYPIMREHLRMGNHVTLISGFRTKELMFWDRGGPAGRPAAGRVSGPLDVIYTTNDGSFGINGFVTDAAGGDAGGRCKAGTGRSVGEVVTIGPPLMMRAVSDLTKPYGVKTVASLNSIMVDATGMCGACMVPVHRRQDGAQARLYRRPGTRRPYHRLGQIPAPLPAVQETGRCQQGPPRFRVIDGCPDDWPRRDPREADDCPSR